jgi:hypothetical protein
MIVEKTYKAGAGLVKTDRVRKGKLQRRKLKSSRKGYRVSGKKLVRMSPAERRRRKISNRRGSRKRAAKLSAIKKKRKISINRGKRAGFYK